MNENASKLDIKHYSISINQISRLIQNVQKIQNVQPYGDLGNLIYCSSSLYSTSIFHTNLTVDR